jgi:hypothetical protein
MRMMEGVHQGTQLFLHPLHKMYKVTLYESVSKSFRTESITKYILPFVLLVEKQHKGLWRQNSLD